MANKAEVALATTRNSNLEVNPHNLKYPEIVTVTESNKRVEATEDHKLTYENGTPKGTVLVKKVSVIHTTIRTTTPYTGTV